METDRTAARPLPGWSGFRLACAQMLGADEESPIGLAAVYYPAVGLLLGAVMLGADRALSNVSLVGASAGVILLQTLATRARWLRGLATTVCRLVVRRRDPAIMLIGLLSALFLVLAIWILAGVEDGRAVILLFAPMLAGCAMVVLATGSRESRRDDRQLKFSRDLSFREFGLASTIAFAIVFLTTNFLGLVLVLLTGATTIALRLLFHWRLGGVDRDSLHATGALVQLVTYSFMTLL